MKKVNLLYLLGLIAFGVVIVSACTKEGPQGPAGEDGINGTDGTATCIQCHDNSQNLFAKINQWEHSVHATGGNYERNTGECATCHTSQGFLGKLDGTYDWEATGAMIMDPNPINCYTCHKIHDTYTTADLAFTVTDPVELMNTGGQTFDFGKGNLCASCHQGRTLDQFPEVGGSDIEVTSTHYGAHHGPQANFFAGMGLFETGQISSQHAHNQQITDACVTCHMADAYGAQAGGHTWNISYSLHGSTEINTAGCVECHDDATTLVENLQSEVEGLMADLKTHLDEAGITDSTSTSPIPGTYPAVVVGAFINYKAVEEDRSLGVHNPTYTRQLLENTIALFKK